MCIYIYIYSGWLVGWLVFRLYIWDPRGAVHRTSQGRGARDDIYIYIYIQVARVPKLMQKSIYETSV